MLCYPHEKEIYPSPKTTHLSVPSLIKRTGAIEYVLVGF